VLPPFLVSWMHYFFAASAFPTRCITVSRLMILDVQCPFSSAAVIADGSCFSLSPLFFISLTYPHFTYIDHVYLPPLRSFATSVRRPGEFLAPIVSTKSECSAVDNVSSINSLSLIHRLIRSSRKRPTPSQSILQI